MNEAVKCISSFHVPRACVFVLLSSSCCVRQHVGAGVDCPHPGKLLSMNVKS